MNTGTIRAGDAIAIRSGDLIPTTKVRVPVISPMRVVSSSANKIRIGK